MIHKIYPGGYLPVPRNRIQPGGAVPALPVRQVGGRQAGSLTHAEKSVFTAGEVAEIIGVTRRQIQHWDYTGLIRPQGRTEGGHARYAFSDLVAFKTVRRLHDAGFSLQRIRKSIAQLIRLLPKVKRPLTELTLVATGEVVLVLYENAAFEAVTGQEWIIEMSDIARDIARWQKKVGVLKPYRRIGRSAGPGEVMRRRKSRSGS